MPEKIKVAYLDYSPHFAGAERALCTIISYLDRTRFEPIIVFPYPSKHHCRYDNLQCEKIYLCDGLKWWMGSDRWKKPVRGSDFVKRAVFGYKLAHLLKLKNVRILHVNLLRPDCMMWLRSCKSNGIYVVGHFRSLPISWVPSKSVQRLCDVIISVSNIVKSHALSRYAHPDNRVIYDSISFTDSSSRIEEIRRLDIISSVAALFPNKGHDNAIRAFALIADRYSQYELHIVGGGNDTELERLKNIAAELDIASRVKFTEKQVDNIDYIYRSSRLVLSLTKEGEAFGLVPFEAALCDTPFIAPDKGAIKEILEDGFSAILVETENVEAIADKISWGLSHYDDCIKICRNARNMVETRLTPQEMDRQIMDVYDGLCSKNVPCSVDF